MSELLAWHYKVDDVGAAGLAEVRVATPDERKALAAALDILSVEKLTADLRISGLAGGRYRLHGHLTAEVVQACVVSLEPVQGTVDEDIDVEFWPADDIGPLAEGEHSVLEGEVPEPIEFGRINAGRVVYEVLAAGLDPYPRAPDADFKDVAVGPGGQQGARISPFEALAKLKDKS